MEQLVLDLTNPQSRENALLELSKKRESFPDLAPYLWHSFGTISALLQVCAALRRAALQAPDWHTSLLPALSQSQLRHERHVADSMPMSVVGQLIDSHASQEIVSIYPLLSPPSLTAHASNRVCNALALLQCVASHPETRSLFLRGAAAAASRGTAS